ncbi:unnamed protein product, partial [Symbiodinium sp. KB8]
NLLSTYEVSQAGLAQSTVSDQMRKRYLILLTPKEGESEEKEGDEETPTPSTPTDSHQKDYILLDIKEVRKDPSNPIFTNTYSHDGKRMIDASKIYAPEFAKGESYATYQDQEFHGREIPTLSIKLKNPLTEDEQMDYAYS